MKLFAVYADVTLTYKPAWLDDFRAMYDKPYPYHVTLKQACYAEEAQVANVKQKLSSFFNTLHVPDHAIPIEFDRLVADEADGSIMIASRQSSLLHIVQQALTSVLSDYRDYYEPASEAWEEDFRPHITIARDLTPELLAQAKREFRPDDLPCGTTTEVTLVVVSNVGHQEAALPENLTHYKL